MSHWMRRERTRNDWSTRGSSRPEAKTVLCRGLAVLACLAAACAGGAGTADTTARIGVSTSGARPYATISSGLDMSCALARSGNVYCWGSNDEGALGDGTTVTQRLAPVQVMGISNQVFISTYGLRTCSVGVDGTVWCWGDNSDGSLGNGATGGPINGGYNWPQQVQTYALRTYSPIVNIVEVAVGGLHVCARDSTGSVWCWGDNGEGQLGDGTLISRSYAKKISGISGAIAITAGGAFTCALLSDHSVSCWGANEGGELGNGTTTMSNRPTAVLGLSNVSAISASDASMFALLGDGTVQCWGSNNLGELARNAPSLTELSPVPLGLSNVLSLSRQDSNTICAVVESTTGPLDMPSPDGGVTQNGVVCWGYNSSGQTGSGFTSLTTTPVPLGSTGGSTPTAIALGLNHGCARTADGNLWCWGDNAEGQLGNNSTNSSSVPVYNDIPDWVSPTQRIAATTYSNTACAIQSAGGAVACWGWGGEGELGNGTQTNTQPTPVYAAGLSNMTAIAGGLQTFAALRGDGTVWCWGTNYENDCAVSGPAPPNMLSTPVQVQSIHGAVAITEGCAVLSDGTVWCWGDNRLGQAGAGPNLSIVVPPAQVPGLTDVVAVTGYWTRCAVRADGTVWCWGSNVYGYVGNGTTSTFQYTPVQVSGLSGVIGISGDGGHKCALKSDGTVWCWGQNDDGALGDGTTINRSTPVQVVGITNAVGVAASRPGASPGFSCAVLSDLTTQCWGSNSYGQLGNGSTSSSPQTTPGFVVSLSNDIEIAAGFLSTYALGADGVLRAWGDNSYGELGIGTVGGTYATPTQASFAP